MALVLADERDVLQRYDLPDPYFGSAPTALLEGFKNRPDIEVHIVGCVRNSLRVPERVADNIYYHAVRVSRWAFLRTAYLPCILKVRKKLRQIQPDIVHGQGTERYQGLCAAYSGFPNVITIHGNMRQIASALRAKPCSFHWLAARLEPWAIRYTAGVICLSRHTQQQVRGLARQTWLVPNAAQEAFFKIERAPAKVPTLLFAANVAPYKNQNLLIRTLDPIASSTEIRLIFVGRVAEGDAYSQEFLSLVDSRPWCTHLGFQAGPALRDHFQNAHVLVLPTLEDNCPMVVLEAMAAGLPVAASRIGGIPDLIDDGVDGLLFDPRNPEAIRSAVLRVLSDSRAANALAAMARKRALERYHPVEIARRHIEIYAQTCRTSQAP